MNIGIDVGGTKIAGALVDTGGTIIGSPRRVATPQGANDIFEAIGNLVDELAGAHVGPIKHVGVGMPGFLDKNDTVVFAGSLHDALVGKNMRAELSSRINAPMSFRNDANCFALAEALYGAGKGKGIVLGVIWGTGVGAGLVVGGTVYEGSFGAALELGHLVAQREPKKILEQFISGPNIIARYQELAGESATLLPTQLTQLYREESIAAQTALGEAIEHMGWGLAAASSILNPDIIVLGGGVSLLPNEAYVRINDVFRAYLSESLRGGIRIVRHGISDDAGIIGAAVAR